MVVVLLACVCVSIFLNCSPALILPLNWFLVLFCAYVCVYVYASRMLRQTSIILKFMVSSLNLVFSFGCSNVVSFACVSVFLVWLSVFVFVGCVRVFLEFCLVNLFDFGFHLFLVFFFT